MVQRGFLAWPLPRGAFTVVANLPFAITTLVRRRLLNPRGRWGMRSCSSSGARRFTRCPSPDPEIVAWHTWFTITWERRVSPSSLVPPPTVDAAAVVLERRQSPDLKPEWANA